ncbi:MAG: hypothetical protein GY864_00565 [Desulfobacterales bacterium]|nr:hypothetical protein [Desulfobacterales bacterium]
MKKFFEALNEANMRYVVLRWFEEVPLESHVEDSFSDDIDMLVDAFEIERLVKIAASFPGKIKCDIYSPSGRKGTTFKKMPYYPPVMADEILDNRELYNSAFYVPKSDVYFKSLSYHLVYHKGPLSGIPTGIGVPAGKNPKRDYFGLIERLSHELEIDSSKPLSLFKLYEFLKQKYWSMPHDLLARWPVQNEWIQWLTQNEEMRLRKNASIFPTLIVFLLREDILENGLDKQAIELLEKKFDILHTEQLSEGQITRVMRSVRGGNWIEHKKTTIIEPRIAVICNDPDPQPISSDDQILFKYPFIKNRNVLYKIEVREKLKSMLDNDTKLIAIHGSDNAQETQHYLLAVYGDRYQEIVSNLHKQLNS